MSSLEEDIKKAKNLLDCCSGDRNKHNNFERLYPFTTENIKDMFNFFDFKDKECLSVLGSSDQVFDMYLRGAKSVTAFDVNPLTKYLFYLKRAGIEALTKEEYLDYFCNYKYSQGVKMLSFNEKSFEKLVPYLNGDSYKFWTKLYDEYKGITIREDGRLFTSYENSRPTLEKTIYYLDDRNYEKMKELASTIKITFINKNIKDLMLSKNYDLMYFSNLIQYNDSIFSDEVTCRNIYDKSEISLQYFKDYIMNNYMTKLNDGGIIIMGYIYTVMRNHGSAGINNKEIRDKIFSLEDYKYKYFPSIACYEKKSLKKYPEYTKDACLVYKKTV